MSKITTADCRAFLSTDAKCRAVWEGSYSLDNFVDCDPEEIEWARKNLANAANPKKWKRIGKYGIGSTTDLDGNDSGAGGGDYGNHWGTETLGFTPHKGDVVREFWLEDTDHCTIVLIEHNGSLHFLDDRSD